MKLKYYLKLHFELTNQHQSPWAVEHNLPPCLITRAIRGDVITLKNAVKISKATGSRVGVIDLIPWIVELIPELKEVE